jgi:pyruvate/2-oxoglutarate dehydrogenase complex dihydrolipoamide acyltransferase (E2) component
VRGSKLSGWRKVAAAMWRAPDDPQIYGALECNARPLEDFLRASRAVGVHLTPTHLIGRAVAHALAEVPDINVRLVGGRAVPRETIDVFFIAAVAGGHDLSGVKIERADAKSAFAIARELDARVLELRQKKDPAFARTKRMTDALPRPLLRAALRLLAWITVDHARGIPPLAITPNPFGSAMISNVGVFGVPVGFAPLAWAWRVPILVLVGEIVDKPVVHEGRVEVGRIIPITATLDHRTMDGWHISRIVHHLRAYLEDPRSFEPAIEG